jgi:hypothetical protein
MENYIQNNHIIKILEEIKQINNLYPVSLIGIESRPYWRKMQHRGFTRNMWSWQKKPWCFSRTPAMKMRERAAELLGHEGKERKEWGEDFMYNIALK